MPYSPGIHSFPEDVMKRVREAAEKAAGDDKILTKDEAATISGPFGKVAQKFFTIGSRPPEAVKLDEFIATVGGDISRVTAKVAASNGGAKRLSEAEAKKFGDDPFNSPELREAYFELQRLEREGEQMSRAD